MVSYVPQVRGGKDGKNLSVYACVCGSTHDVGAWSMAVMLW